MQTQYSRFPQKYNSSINFGTLERLLGARDVINVPCPTCSPWRKAAHQREKVLRIWRKDPDFLTFHCVHCDISGFAHRNGPRTDIVPSEIKRGQTKAEAAARVLAARQTERSLAMWNEAGSIANTLAAAYLNRRNILATALPFDGAALRFHPSCPFDGDRLPCLLVLMRDVVTDAPTGVRRTALAPHGNKIGRMALGRKKGAAIKFGTPADRLTVGEGVETVLSAMTLGMTPAWAMGDAHEIASLPIIAGVETLQILVDNDPSGTGQRAAHECSARWRRAGRSVSRLVPINRGEDFNDVLLSTANGLSS